MGIIQDYDGALPQLPQEGQAWIAPTAALVGSVELGRDVSLWYGAVVRGDNEPIKLGAGTNVQENAILHVDPGFPMVIGENVTIGHGAILHGCTIDDGCIIGMGSIVMNGAKIGKNCLIAAGAVVLEKTEIPDGALVVGSPATVKRTLSETAQAGLLRGAETYQKKAPKLLSPVTL